MVRVEIDLAQVTDWASFHAAFAQAMGFPDFYGANMNAWEDCMSDLSRPGTVGMTTVQVRSGEPLVLVLRGAIAFRTRLPKVFAALVDSTAHVNQTKAAIPGGSELLLLFR